MKKIYAHPSSEALIDLRVIEWLPKYGRPPKAVLQIVHGMAEHIERYEEFALFLNQAGIAVIGHDHLGHGYSVSADEATYGYFSKEHAKEKLIDDVEKVTQIMEEEYPGIPHFLLGHSMGSFIIRNYLQETNHFFDGVIFMGTSGPRKEIKAILPVLSRLNKFQGKKVNHQINQLAFGHYRHFFPEDYSEFDWLSKNRENVDQFLADPLSGFVFTNNGFYTLFQLIEGATCPGWANRLNCNQHCLVVSGEQDPVGQMGKGPKEVAEELNDAGMKEVTLLLYRHLRHEILNETERPLVYQNILDWIQKEI